MIIVQIKGGLGNQLFQYAFARSLAYNLNKELFLDISYFSHNEKRKHVIYGLNAFNIKGIVGYYPYSEESSVGINYLSDSKVTEYKEGIKVNFPKDIFDYGIVKDIKNIQIPAYFDGYFQQQINNDEQTFVTENFFKVNNEIIHEDLEYRETLSEDYSNIIKEMEDYDSIALHIRHGDYENIPEFGLCTVEYYQKAIDYMASKVKNPKFFIFTENHEWAKENLEIDFPVEHIFFNEKINVIDRGYAELLKIMSLCDHFIIANSTFSWWGAFLSNNKNKIIVAPKPWFQDRSFIEVDTIDNVKTKNILNNYNKIFYNSSVVLYESNEKNIFSENINLILGKDNKFSLVNLSNDSKLFLSDIKPKDFNNNAIINIKFKSRCLNCLKIYYKTLNKDYCEENSLSLYYYKHENVNHYLIIPKEALLNELMIKPYTLDYDGKNKIFDLSIEIKEMVDNNKLNNDELYVENNRLKENLFWMKKEFDEKLCEKDFALSQYIFELDERNRLYSELEERFNLSSAELDERNRLYSELEERFNLSSAELDERNRLYSELEERFNLSSAELDERNRLYSELEERFNLSSAELDERNRLYSELEERFNLSSAELDERNRLYSELEERFNLSSAELDERNRLYSELEERFNLSSAELDERNRLYSELEERFNLSSAELDERNRLYSELEERFNLSSAELDERNRLYSELEERFNLKNIKYKKLIEKNDKLKSENENLKDIIKSQNEDILKLKEDFINKFK